MSARDRSNQYREEIRKEGIETKMKKMRNALVQSIQRQASLEEFNQNIKLFVQQNNTQELYIACFRTGHVSKIDSQAQLLYKYATERLEDVKCALIFQSLVCHHYKKIFIQENHQRNQQIVFKIVSLTKKWIEAKIQKEMNTIQQQNNVNTQFQAKCINIYLACIKSIVLHTQYSKTYTFTKTQQYIDQFIEWLPLLFKNSQFLSLFTLLCVDLSLFSKQSYKSILVFKLTPLLPLIMAQVTADNKSTGVQSATLIFEALKQLPIQCVCWLVKPFCSMIVQIHIGSRSNPKIFQEDLFRKGCKIASFIMEKANFQDYSEKEGWGQQKIDIAQILTQTKLAPIISILLQIECVQQRVILLKIVREMLRNEAMRKSNNLNVMSSYMVQQICAGLQSTFDQIVCVSLECIEFICCLRHPACMEEHIEDFFSQVREGQLKYIIQSLEYHKNTVISCLSNKILQNHIRTNDYLQ